MLQDMGECLQTIPVYSMGAVPECERPSDCPGAVELSLPAAHQLTSSRHATSHSCHHPHRRARPQPGRARAAAPDAKVWAIVKANAYGHGIERVFDALRSADGFALLDLAEAQRLRALDWRGPILLLEGCFDARDLELCSRLGLWHAIHCNEQIDMLAAHKTQLPHRVFLKMNSGMNRLGFPPERFRAAWTRLNALPQVEEITLMTHFSDADGPKGIARRSRPLRPSRTTCPASAP
jgi:hypothetical protein